MRLRQRQPCGASAGLLGGLTGLSGSTAELVRKSGIGGNWFACHVAGTIRASAVQPWLIIDLRHIVPMRR